MMYTTENQNVEGDSTENQKYFTRNKWFPYGQDRVRDKRLMDVLARKRYDKHGTSDRYSQDVPVTVH